MKEKFVRDFFSYGGYGWAGNKPDSLQEKLREAIPAFNRLRSEVNFDAIAFTGSSGACIAFVLAYETRIPLLYVRKAGEKSHGSRLECNLVDGSIKKYLIVDDFIDSGETICKMVKSINRNCARKSMNSPKPVGVFLFETSCFTPERTSIGKDNWLPCWSPDSFDKT